MPVMAVGALVAAPVASAEQHCAAGWRFSNVKTLRKSLDVTERLRVENLNSSTQSATFTSKTTKTRGWHLDAEVKGSADAIFASIETSVGGGIERSTTAESGVSVKAKVPPKSYLIGRYGVYMNRYSGRLTHGTRTNQCLYDRKRVVRAPSGQRGWRVTKYKFK